MRAVDEPAHPYRTCFQRDRDRVVHSTAMRRMDFKTQVFTPHLHDHLRTRYTHTVEVAQVARTLGTALRLNADLIEAVALAHDLGHPPFGHGGERTLDELMRDHGGFEHNRQSLRVVDYLERPYPQFHGLNLTRAVRECIARHETRYDTPVCPEFPPGRLGPLEGQVVDLADEIAYTAADLEDAFQANWLTVADVADLELWRAAWRRVRAAWPDARDIHKQIRTVQTVTAVLVDDAVAASGATLEAMDLRSPDDVRAADAKAVALSPGVRDALDAMQEFLLERVYRRRDNAAHERRARDTLVDLFGAFETEPGLLPERFARRIDADGLHRTLCDYIAGMTDRYAREEHARVTGAKGRP